MCDGVGSGDCDYPNPSEREHGPLSQAYESVHLFPSFWTDFWFCVMFWDAFTKGQFTEADNNTEDQKPGN